VSACPPHVLATGKRATQGLLWCWNSDPSRCEGVGVVPRNCVMSAGCNNVGVVRKKLV